MDTYAAIDIGTNTVLLLIADIDKGRLIVREEEQRMPRLGRGVDASRRLSDKAIGDVLDILQEYRKRIEEFESPVKKVLVTATSAVRDAENREEFLQEVISATGYRVQLLSGREEAEYTCAGALSVLPGLSEAVILDIGGGSTEIAFGSPDKLMDSYSYDMGSVRFTEQFLHGDPPSPGEVDKCREAIRRTLNNRPLIFEDDSFTQKRLVGVAGTVTSVAYMDLGLSSYEPDALNGQIMSMETIASWISYIMKRPADRLRDEFPEVMEGRADIILGGLLILHETMNYYSFRELTVSTGGIRHGAIMRHLAGLANR